MVHARERGEMSDTTSLDLYLMGAGLNMVKVTHTTKSGAVYIKVVCDPARIIRGDVCNLGNLLPEWKYES